MLTRPSASKAAADAIGVVDIGTSKTACLILSVPESRVGSRRRRENARVLGFGCKPTRGLKAGVVIDHDGAEQALRSAVVQAEQTAGMTIDDVFVAVTCGRLNSRTLSADTSLDGKPVTAVQIERLTSAGRRYAEREGGTLLHMNCLGYRLDGSAAGSDPLGMTGTALAADLHVVTVDDAPLRSLLNVVERGGMTVAGVAPAPYASGLASTTGDERHAGVVCIDLGAGATTLSIFASGRLVSVDAIAVGGQHLTFDIARELATPFDQAERIKTVYGTLEDAVSDDRGMVAYTLAGEEEPTLYQTTRSRIRDIISSRVSNLLANVIERIERSGAGHLAASQVVLTGGGSALPGLSSFAEHVMHRPVRIAQLQPALGLPSDWCTPEFSTVVGLSQVAFEPGAGVRMKADAGADRQPGYLERVGQWLRRGS